jgi:hypothetical protein
MTTQHQRAKAGVAKAKPEVIKLGLDLHARQVTECRQLDAFTPKPAQEWDPWQLLAQVEAWVKAGIKVYSYEAGAGGYWYHRQLLKAWSASRSTDWPPSSNCRNALVIITNVWNDSRFATKWLYLMNLRCSSRTLSAITPSPPKQTHCTNSLNASLLFVAA